MRRAATAAIVAALITPAAAAEEWGPPTADYSAVLSFVDGRGEALVHRMYYSEKRQRLDYKAGERAEIAIVDQVAAAVFVLYPDLKRYKKSPLVEPEFDFGISRAETKREKIGDEKVDGTAAAKYRIEAKTAQGQEFKGVAWLTPDRIVVKLEGEVRQGRRARRLAMNAREVNIGPVDPAVFAIPPAYALIEDKRP